MSHRYRFTSTSGTATNITMTSIALAAGGICTVANSQIRSLFASLRVNFIEIWSPCASIGSFSTCSVDWISSGGQTNNVEISDTSTSVSFPAHILTSPPAGSLQRLWQRVDVSTPMCTLVAPTGSIIDIHLSLVFSDQDIVTNATVATATLGTIYYLSLDDNSTHRFVPVSLNTTT